MSFSKTDLDIIKSKISISSELEKKTKLIQKGRDYWCCCPFHKEKTPSCKINDDQGSFYCFGCGAKGDIFTLYTDLYNYNFIDAVKELSQRAGVIINFQDIQQDKQENKVVDILKLTCEWYQHNLEAPDAQKCKLYLSGRNLSDETISKFKLGYSYNASSTLYKYLKEKSFNDYDLLKSNVVKLDKNDKIRDFFYKRLIFPILNLQGRIVGFGGRALDDSNPKYINSPESKFFQKRHLLYNLNLAKNTARKKNNILICEGYMDVISLFQNGLQSVVAPLGTALTEEQLQLSWKYSSKPTIMFDGDNAGIRASYKSAIMALPLISAKKFLQFVTLPEGFDPDSYINNVSFNEFVQLLRKPQSLPHFIFSQSSNTVKLNNADEKISYDKYLEDLVQTIKDKKTQYFYKSEFKTLFFDKIRQLRLFPKEKSIKVKKINTSLYNQQILSFIASAINHALVRQKILDGLVATDLLDKAQQNLIKDIKSNDNLDLQAEALINKLQNSNHRELIISCLNSKIYQLFPYSHSKFDPQLAYQEVLKSLKNLNTRLLNLKKINKSLDNFVSNSNVLNWSELQNINLEISDED
ncbi:DNA primase [Alphaproteobacteria bacterium]|nr:DNA primase [Alphaproteobacteria bacterium]